MSAEKNLETVRQIFEDKPQVVDVERHRRWIASRYRDVGTFSGPPILSYASHTIGSFGDVEQ